VSLSHITLEPLSQARFQELWEEIGSEPEVYKWLTFATPKNFEELASSLNFFLEEMAIGKRFAYAVILKESNRAIGTTSFLDINPQHQSIEIGSTFYSKKYWRSYVNTECKLAMLSEAFEVRDAERVTLKTDSLNERSRAAITRLGASFEGILRHHMKRPDGTWRDSAYFSILKSEWPMVKETLLAKLENY
jgi:RimJ/RimL family protein N-acetyltransferase